MTTAATTTTTGVFDPGPVDDERSPSWMFSLWSGDRANWSCFSLPRPTLSRHSGSPASSTLIPPPPAEPAFTSLLFFFDRPRRMPGACRRWIVFRSGHWTPTGAASPFLVPLSPDTLAPPHLRLPPLLFAPRRLFFDFVFRREGKVRLDSHTTACDPQQLSRMRTSRTDAPRSRRRLAGLSPAFFGFGYLFFWFFPFGWSGWWYIFSLPSSFLSCLRFLLLGFGFRRRLVSARPPSFRYPFLYCLFCILLSAYIPFYVLLWM
ncbi:hypothetical protein B0H19DRAFT_466119 [Mycena capillaripes]|nr:hypothetical protein B0H19DRAFT_466119 [Mycena capillaripes]